MSPLWLLPGAVVVIGVAVIFALFRSVTEEAKLLIDELTRQRDVSTKARRLADSVRERTQRARSVRR